MHQQIKKEALAALKRFEELVREDEMKGAQPPDEAEEIVKKLAIARRELHKFLPKEYVVS